MLLERPGEVVTRDELRNRLWPNTVVEFDHGLNKAISKIREVLGDSVESPRFVETVARRGYRFLADVAVVDIPDRQSEPTPDALASPSDTAPVDRTDAGASSKQAVRPYIWSLVFGLALVLTVLKAFASRWPRLPAG
jgi:DNA-binding winged helix-turn-helix (wHTH) protein